MTSYNQSLLSLNLIFFGKHFHAKKKNAVKGNACCHISGVHITLQPTGVETRLGLRVNHQLSGHASSRMSHLGFERKTRHQEHGCLNLDKGNG